MLAKYGPWMAWGLVLWGVLQISGLPFPATHGVCGPWGCGPPVPALVACHAAWLVIFAPVAYFIPIRLSCFQSKVFGWSMISLGVFGVLGVGVYQSFTWLTAVSESLRPYFIHRWAFSVVTLTDVPMIQATILGAIFVFLGREQTTLQVSESDQSRDVV